MSKLKQTFATVTIVSVLIWGALPGGVSAVTAAELQAQIDALMAQLSGLQAQLPSDTSGAASASGAPAACSGVTLSRSLTVGSSGTDVKCLQALLNQSADTQVAASGVGSAGNETLYFGNLTRAAVVKYQEKYSAAVLAPVGLSAGTGFFGPSTRTQANSMLAAGGVAATPATPASGLPAGCASTAGYSPTTGVKCDTVTTTTPTTTTPATPAATADTVLASVASDNPAANVHASGTAYNSVLKVNFTAPSSGQVSLTGITLKKGGISLDSTLAGVAAFDSSNNRLTNNFVTFADSKATLTFAKPFVIAAGATAPIVIKTNPTGTAGTYNVSIVAAEDIKGATASGTFPITSNAFTMVSGTGTVGGVTLDGVIVHGNGTNDATAVNINLGTVNQELAKFRFVANANEDVNISKIVMYNNGNTSDVDIQNIDLVGPDGTVLSTVAQPVDRNVVFDLSAAPYKLLKGTTRDLSVRVDVVSGSTRNFRLVVQNDYDVELKGVSTGSGLLITAAAAVDAAFPIGDSSGAAASCAAGNTCMNKITVSSGTALFSKANTSPSGNVSAGASSVVLGKWNMTPQGEDMELRTMAYILTYGTALTGTFKIKVNDTTVYTVAGGSTGATGVSTAVTLATYPVLPAGVQATITIEGDINSTTAAGATYLANLDVTQVKRLSTNDLIDPSITATAANTLTVSTAALAVSKNSSLANMTVVAGLADAKVGSFNLTASSTENVSVSSITVGLTNTTNISNLTLKTSDGVQLGSVTTSPSTSNVISITGFSIAKGTTKTVDVFVTTNGSTTGTEVASITAVSATGSSSSTTVTATGLTATGQTATLSSGGTLTLALDTTNTPVAQTLHSSQVDTTLLAVRLAASNAENIKITTVQISSTNGVTSLQNLKLIVDGVQKGVTTSLSNGVASFTDANGLFTVPQDTTVTMYVRGSTTTSGSIASQAVAGLALDYVEAIGSSGGTKIKPGTTLNTTYTATDTDANGADITVGSTAGFHAGDVVFVYDGNSAGSLGMVTTEPTATTTMNVATLTAVASPSSNTVSKIESGATTAASAGDSGTTFAAVEYTVTNSKAFAVGDPVLILGATTVQLGFVTAIGSTTTLTARALSATATGTASRISKIGTATLTTGITATTALTTTTAPIATTVTSTTGFNVGDFVLIQDTGVAGTFGMVTAIGSSTGISLAVNANVTPGSTSSATLIRVGSANPATTLVTTGATAAARVIAATAATVTDTTGFGAGDVVITAAATAGGTAPTAVSAILGKIGAITSGTVMTIGATTADAAAASTRVTRLPGAAASGAALTLHDVELTISNSSSFTGGSTAGVSGQTVGMYNVKADGDRNVDLTSVRVKMGGSNFPYAYVTSFDLYNGANLLSSNTSSIGTATADAGAWSLTAATTTIKLCNVDTEAGANGELNYVGLGGASGAIMDKIKAGDTIVFFESTTAYVSYTVTSATVGAACTEGSGDAGDVTLVVSGGTLVGTVDDDAPTLYNYTVTFDSQSSTPLASQSITAGSTLPLTVVANTTSVKTGVTSGSVNFNTQVRGTQGSTGDFTWGYTPSGESAITGLQTSDSYPVNGPTLVY
jgi:hypothetical protein